MKYKQNVKEYKGKQILKNTKRLRLVFAVFVINRSSYEIQEIMQRKIRAEIKFKFNDVP